jgi:drug/metabolite transporter (DMT)-like permease
VSRGPRRGRSARTSGALAVVGVVIAFSLSSTLVKRAHSPGVLLAFWRMVTVSVVWNVYLRSTGRRITMRDVRQALVPGTFFGLNLATFFAGATNNSVANAALIGSLSPFLIVPVGATLFREYINPRALVFALIAFGGVGIVLFSAPSAGDASLRGNVFGVVAMLLWTGYVVSTRYFRRDMDVATFLSTISPIAAVAVVPLAIANGDVAGLSRTGWTYMLVLALLTGVAAHGLNVFAQKTIPIGTIGIAQVAQPALAVLWSFLLLGETLRPWQVAGVALVLGGLLLFLVLNERGARAHRTRLPDADSRELPDPASVGPVELGDEVRGNLHAKVSLSAELLRGGHVVGVGGDAGEGVEGEHLDGGVVAVPGVLEDGEETLPDAVATVGSIHRR